MKGRRTDRRWEAAYDAGTQTYVVSGKGIERLVAMTQLQNEDAVNRLQRTLEKTGIINKLRTLGAKQGDTVRIGKAVFDFFDEYALDKPEDEKRRRPCRGEPACSPFLSCIRPSSPPFALLRLLCDLLWTPLTSRNWSSRSAPAP